MLAGLTVVSVPITGFSETVIDGSNGYLVPFGKASALADAIDDIASERSN